MSRSRSVAVLVGGAVLVVALAGCSDPPQGTVVATNGNLVQVISNPGDTYCHRFIPGGVNAVQDGTLADMRLYRSTDCSGHNDYLSTQTSVGPQNTLFYRSYSFVGQ
ncbi:hypothetical protein [Streptacidiphilus jiangxiensis]|uniref:Uncharacterized protein n=1 Tax=Streptacidiphilus jiangxiensis TaxID=235985 RepID=A0A1H7WP79_STRJI|nr:hypothetical protein [Streptacidiphilus jiangxiensis]SEM23293.1 hypothetical protein SAMN05414137_12130 [Streptacidiphilus jiangxiensis]